LDDPFCVLEWGDWCFSVLDNIEQSGSIDKESLPLDWNIEGKEIVFQMALAPV